MIRTRLRSDSCFALAVTAAAMLPAPLAASGHAVPSGGATAVSLVLPAQSGCQVAGPFPTMRRANEVAAEARRRGYNAIAYHNGDGYYVRAC